MNLQEIKGTTPEKPKRKTKISDEGKLVLSSFLWASLVMAVFVALALLSCLFLNDASQLIGSIDTVDTAVAAVYDGKIIDKRIVNADTNAFRSSETEYRLYINVDYEVDGKQQTTTKYFCVPESTYLLYDIGDYFNSHSFEIE